MTPVKDLKKSLQQVFFHCAGDGPSQLLESDDPRDGECGQAATFHSEDEIYSVYSVDEIYSVDSLDD